MGADGGKELKMNTDGYSDFATFSTDNYLHFPDHSIIKSIVRKLEEENKKVIQYYNDPSSNSRFDILAPEGIGNIIGSTVIEIINKPKEPLSVGQMVNVKMPLKSPSKMMKEIGVHNYLLIFTFPLNIDNKRGVIDSFKKNKSNIKITVWDSEDLNKYLGKKFAGDSNFIQTIFESSKENIRNQEKEREKLLELLSREYQKERLALFIGAGVSKDAGLDSWDDLINGLQLKILNSKLGLRATKLELNALLKSHIYHSNSGQENIFHESNRLLLDASLIKMEFGDYFDSELQKSLYQKMGKNHPIIDALVELCHFQIMKRNISAIITYNYDSLLEDNLKENSDFDFQVISNATEIPDRSKIPIFHVHGYIPSSLNDQNKPNKVVISDEDYYELYLNFYHWSNIVQISHLRNNSCLFIGISFKDPNLRRILYHLSKESNIPRHYAFMKKNQYQKVDPKIVREELKSQFEALEMEFTENNLQKLGVQIIWVDGYSEIPNLIREIKKKSRNGND